MPMGCRWLMPMGCRWLMPMGGADERPIYGNAGLIISTSFGTLLEDKCAIEKIYVVIYVANHHSIPAISSPL
jgi:hypothetical protein